MTWRLCCALHPKARWAIRDRAHRAIRQRVKAGGVSNGGTTTTMDSTLLWQYGNWLVRRGLQLCERLRMLAITGSTLSGMRQRGDGGAGLTNGGYGRRSRAHTFGQYGRFRGGGVNNLWHGDYQQHDHRQQRQWRRNCRALFRDFRYLVEDAAGTGLLNTVTGLIRCSVRFRQRRGRPSPCIANRAHRRLMRVAIQRSINAGNPTDQRGENGFVGTVDIGAFRSPPAMNDVPWSRLQSTRTMGTTDPGTGAGTFAALKPSSRPTRFRFDDHHVRPFASTGTPSGVDRGPRGKTRATGDLDIHDEIVIQGTTTNTLNRPAVCVSISTDPFTTPRLPGRSCLGNLCSQGGPKPEPGTTSSPVAAVQDEFCHHSPRPSLSYSLRQALVR